MLSAGDEVRSLLGEYCRRIDAGDFDGVGELFAHGTLCTSDGAVLARGAGEVAAFYRGIVLPTGDTQHLVANTSLSVSGEHLLARSSYVVLQGLVPIVTGSYTDTFALASGAWAFAERRFSVAQTGDLSRHLAPGILP